MIREVSGPGIDDLFKILKSTYLFEKSDDSILVDLLEDSEIISFEKGDILFRQGDPGGTMGIVITGLLTVAIQTAEGKEIQVAEIHPGAPVGEIQLLTGGTRTASVYAAEKTDLLQLTKAAFDRIDGRHADFIQEFTEIIRWRLRRNLLMSMLPGVFGALDAEMLNSIEDEVEWVFLKRNEMLFSQGDSDDSFFILISGRLIVVINDPKDGDKKTGEIRPGESVGEMAMIAGERRSESVFAVRESELVKIQKSAFERVIYRYPQVTFHIMKLLVHRFQKTISASQTVSNVVNFAILPASPDLPLTDFADRLAGALSNFGNVLHLNSERLEKFWDMPGMSQVPAGTPKHIRLTSWLDEQETKYNFILYQTDRETSQWSIRCIQRADYVLIVGDASQDPKPSGIEAELFGKGDLFARPESTLIILHPDGAALPRGTKNWLIPRRVERHLHVRWDNQADYMRVARFLTGNAVGLVLGGGGARGLAHMGVIRALEEADMPIDMICGTSMGAIMAGIYAMGWDHATRMQKARASFVDVNPVGDYTFPTISIVKSSRLEYYLKLVLGETQIEDLWLNYFCVSSNLTTAELVIHDEGTLWQGIRASISLPGILKPVLRNGELLIDGGVINNLPADIMRDRCKGIVMMVNVSPDSDLIMPENCQTIPSSWEYLWSRINPFKKTIDMPTIMDIMMRTTMLASINQATRVKSEVDYYFRPPVDHFGLLNFKALEDIVEVGYQYAKREIEDWKMLREELSELDLD